MRQSKFESIRIKYQQILQPPSMDPILCFSGHNQIIRCGGQFLLSPNFHCLFQPLFLYYILVSLMCFPRIGRINTVAFFFLYPKPQGETIQLTTTYGFKTFGRKAFEMQGTFSVSFHQHSHLYNKIQLLSVSTEMSR